MKDKEIAGKTLHNESLMMSYGYKPELSEGAVKCPIFQTSTFVFKSAEEGKEFFEVAYGKREPKPEEVQGLIYSRINNPDLEILEDRLTLWDSADAAAVFESGMAAITTTILEFLRPGDYILHTEPLYGGTNHFFKHILPQFGITPIGAKPTCTYEELESLVLNANADGKLGIVYIETPANPTNDLVDIALYAKIAKRFSGRGKEVITVVDNTFLGPLWQHPLAHGADLVLYSATKYIGGHSDVIAGVCLGRADLMTRVKGMRTFLGTMAGPWTGWLLLRSLETLKLRMTSQMKNARYVADFLTNHPKVEKVYYLGNLSEDNEQFAVYRKQCLSPGAMISFDVIGGEAEAFRCLNALKMIKLAVSLGGTESLAEHPASMTHADVSDADKALYRISDKMIRLSVGVEHPEDIILDLEQALAHI